MKNLKNIKLNKLITFIISIAVVAGMAASTFATNVDLEAFVRKDLYMSKFYELDFRIKDIDLSLDRLYKYTCTNLKSFGGAGNHSRNINPFYNSYSTSPTYHWYVPPHADFSEEGYLRFNPSDAINAFGNHSKTDKFVRELPATLFTWKDGIETYPETTFTYTITRVWPNTTSSAQNATYTYEIVMGPFKKFPHITASSYAWNTTSICKTKYSFGLRGTDGTTYYARNTKTKPTSWTSMSGGIIRYTTVGRGNQSWAQPEFEDDPMTEQEMKDNAYKDSLKSDYVNTTFYFNNAPGTNLSGFKDVWLRYSLTITGIEYWMDAAQMNLTTWNYNK